MGPPEPPKVREPALEPGARSRHSQFFRRTGNPPGNFRNQCSGRQELPHAARCHLPTCQLTTNGPSNHDLQTGSVEGQPAGSPSPGSCEACAAWICGRCVAQGVIRADHHRRRQGRLPRRQWPDHPPRRRRQGRHPLRASPGPDGRIGGVRLQGRSFLLSTPALAEQETAVLAHQQQMS